MAGIYIHIPFCKQACTYCNFHFSTSLSQKRALLDAIVKEIALTPLMHSAPEKIETIYFGGGTPSIITIDELKKILAAIYKKFTVVSNAEITLEANPDDISHNSLLQWKQAGINRFSLGVQSFDEDELVWMNRAHNATESLQSIRMIQDTGFTNFSIDLIYGSPLQSNERLLKNLDIIFNESVPHISCYALTVEPKTALDYMIRKKNSVDTDPAKQASQFLLLMEKLPANGYEHYEISNYARPGMRSKHNSSYWQGKIYYGFGPAAHSYDGRNRRQWNIANNALYIQSLQKDTIPAESELLTPDQELNEYLMTALRTIEGIDIQYMQTRFPAYDKKLIVDAAEKFIRSGKMKLEGYKLFLTNEGKLLADGIAADLFV